MPLVPTVPPVMPLVLTLLEPNVRGLWPVLVALRGLWPLAVVSPSLWSKMALRACGWGHCEARGRCCR